MKDKNTINPYPLGNLTGKDFTMFKNLVYNLVMEMTMEELRTGFTEQMAIIYRVAYSMTMLRSQKGLGGELKEGAEAESLKNLEIFLRER